MAANAASPGKFFQIGEPVYFSHFGTSPQNMERRLMLISAPSHLRYQGVMSAIDVSRVHQALVNVSLNRETPLQASNQHVKFDVFAEQMLPAHKLR